MSVTKTLRTIAIITFILTVIIGLVFSQYSSSLGGNASTGYEKGGTYFLGNETGYTEVAKNVWYQMRIFEFIYDGMFVLSIAGLVYLMIYMIFFRED